MSIDTPGTPDSIADAPLVDEAIRRLLKVSVSVPTDDQNTLNAYNDFCRVWTTEMRSILPHIVQTIQEKKSARAYAGYLKDEWDTFAYNLAYTSISTLAVPEVFASHLHESRQKQVQYTEHLARLIAVQAMAEIQGLTKRGVL
jgi:hypothetical protein